MEFDFNVVDGASGPLKAMGSGLDGFDKQLKRTNVDLGKFELGTKHAGGGAREGAEGAKGFFESLIEADVLKEAAEMAMELGEKIFDLGKEFVSAGLEMADFRNDALLSIGAITGNEEGAGDLLEVLEAMSKGTKLTGEQMFGDFQHMGEFTKKFGKDWSIAVISGVQDVNTAFGKEAGDAVSSAIENMTAMGRLDERAMRGLKGSRVAGPEALTKYLADQHHTGVKQIDGMLKAGKISAIEGTQAIMSLIHSSLDKGGALGSLSKKSADQDFGTQIKNMKDHMRELFEKVNSKPLVDAVAKLGALFDPATERGKKLETINRMFKGVGDVVTWVTEGDKLSKVFDTVGKYAEVAWPIIKGLGIVIGVLGVGVLIASAPLILMGAAFYVVAGAALYAIGSIGKIWDKLKLWGSEAIGIGANFVHGLVDGIKGMWGHLVSTVTDLAHALPAAVRKALGIHSRSKVMFEIGGYYGQGMEEGIQAKIPAVRARAMDVMLPTPKYSSRGIDSASLAAPALAVPSARGGGSRSYQGGDVYVELHVDGAHDVGPGDHEQLAAFIVKRVREEVQPVVRAEIVRFMEDDSIAN